jgi:methylmalonyl-CoA/ethylmalonyl-CoA epimerase
MKILGIDHIGIAARSADKAASFWNGALGLHGGEKELVAEQKVTTLPFHVGDSALEVLEPTDPTSAVARFIESRGEGIQHIALRVENIDEALAELRERGVQLIDSQPRIGAGGTRIAFVHPKATYGVLLELVERPS